MEKGSEPLTESEKADLEAITALKESAALELKVYNSWFTIVCKNTKNLSLLISLHPSISGKG